ncbi:MAG TPA: LysM peptidoglycan-binding domain-containing protein [Tepidisphaeraceae bacterium]|jgi:nucleoid-associated protein YgaU|nr:LysM peptidoglycan-binding domain-containing protein [Tepidisphaeraceae bacterium]
MTRETKIGLLVGLAFIIVVAILLSDPVNNANEPPAAIADTLGTVNKGLTVPAPTTPPTGTTAVVTPGRTSGQYPILTPAEAAGQNPQTEIKVGPANASLKPIIPQAPPTQDDSQVAMQQSNSPGRDDALVTPDGDADPLQKVASEHNEKLVPGDSRDLTPAGTGDATTPAASDKKHYTAEPGDSVSKMASRLMGANTKANRAAIIAANASLKKDPNRVIVGEVYVIPGAEKSPAASADTDAQAPAPANVAQALAPDKRPSRWYVVKPNDNLWRIATDEVGDSGAVAEIISLNKDILKGGDTIHPNMRLRLPPKTVAAAD